MRNTKKKQTLDNIVNNSEEIRILLKQIVTKYDITDLPYSYDFHRHSFEEIIDKKIKIGNFKITGTDIIEQFIIWLNRSDTFPASIVKLTKSEAISNFPKMKETIESRKGEYTYYYLRSYNPNAHRNMYEIIAHLIDASTDTQMQIIHNANRKEALFGVFELREVSGYGAHYYRTRWTDYVRDFLEVFSRTYKWYE